MSVLFSVHLAYKQPVCSCVFQRAVSFPTMLHQHHFFIFFTAFREGDKLCVVAQHGENKQPVRQTWLRLNYTFVECNLRNVRKDHFMMVLHNVRQDPRNILGSAHF